MCAGSLSSQLSQQRCGWADQWSGTDLVTTGSTLPLSSHLEPAEQPKVVSNVCTSLADKAQDLQETCALLEEHPDSEGKERTNQMHQCGQESSPTLPPASTDHRQKVFSWIPFNYVYIFVQICKQKPLSLYFYTSLHVSSYNSFLQRPHAPTKHVFVCLHFQDGTGFARYLCGT